MSERQEVLQWMEEIRDLKQQLREMHRDRVMAQQREAKWRELYATEAQQRRTDARLAQEQIEQLKAQIAQLETEQEPPEPDDPDAIAAIEAEIAELNSIEACKVKLYEVMRQRDRFYAAYKTEQIQHAQTRENLLSLLSDTVSIVKQSVSIGSVSGDDPELDKLLGNQLNPHPSADE